MASVDAMLPGSRGHVRPVCDLLVGRAMSRVPDGD